ncbi:MAG: phosphate ABC transporter substrate-binding protein PstS [Gemmatimonadaceae bacterium]|nr:phosphate ABC transporter substrate-binding protein PstS [Gemmatimonadaceae bacterium]
MLLGGCGDARTARAPAPAAGPEAATLEGAGATFPYPVYTRWFSRFHDERGIRINYRSVGSGAGIQALGARTIDFAATDAPLTTDERSMLQALGIRQVPLIVGGAAVSYNVPGVLRQLRLDGAALSDIFLGRISRWDDARLVALNPDITLPAADIRIVVRADSSGTSWIFTDYLARSSAAWATGPGRTTFPAWPVGVRVRGNEGVASEIKATVYSIGVVEAVYAMQNRLQVARIRNHAGAWVTPQTGALRAAASAMLTSIEDTVEFATSISDAPGELSYPIASLSWLIVPTRGVDAARTAAIRRFVRWALEHGGSDALTLGYAPLPDAMRRTLLRAWDSPVQ